MKEYLPNDVYLLLIPWNKLGEYGCTIVLQQRRNSIIVVVMMIIFYTTHWMHHIMI